MSAPAGTLPPPSRVVPVPGMLLRQAQERGSKVALRDRHGRQPRETTWAQYARRTARLGLALAELGIRPGDRVGILSRNRPEWAIAALAIEGIGCVSVGLHPTSSASELEYVLAHSEARVLLAEDEGQLSKALAVRDRLPALERIVVMEAGGPARRTDRGVATLSELEQAVPARHAVEDWASHVDGLDPASVATIAYTAGTTGRPRGAMLTHANLAWASATLRGAFAARSDDEILSLLPLCHVAERVASVATAVSSGCVVTFGASDASSLRDIRDVQPTIIIAGPPVWEKLLDEVESRMADPARAKRAAWASGGRRAGDALLRRRLRRQLGLSRVRVALSAAAPTTPRVLECLLGLGVEVRETYGLTESTFVCTLAPPGAGRPGTVGRVLADVEVRIVSDDEILVHSPGVFAGYFRDEPATDQAIDSAGWLHTGDAGMFEADGFLTIAGRKRSAASR